MQGDNISTVEDIQHGGDTFSTVGGQISAKEGIQYIGG